MGQKLTFFPIGNAETCLLELESGKKILFDFADTSSADTSNINYDIKKDLGVIGEFEVVLFSHPHEDHLKGASDFFYLEHAVKYQNDRIDDGKKRAKIKELWVSAAFLLDSDLENQSDAKIIRQEARHRLRNKSGIKVFATPNKLSKWLDSEKLTEEEVKEFLVDSGSKMDLSHLGVENEVQVYVHGPFAEDSEEVEDKNTPSIVLQVRLLNGQRETNVFMTGDAPYDVLSRIVERAVDSDNEEYLKWDLYDIPHHCSRTGLNEKSEKAVPVLEPAKNVKVLLKASGKNAYMVASCIQVTEETSPPHMEAKRAYEQYTNDDVTLKITMENKPFKSNIPKPLVFEVDNCGLTLLNTEKSSEFIRKHAPRAGL